MVAIGKPAQADRVIIDSGASGSFCVEGTPLSNAKATRRIISSAGSQKLVGRAMGDWGCLKGTVALQGLRTGLASVSQITDHYQAFLVFTPTEVFAIPKANLEGILQDEFKIGKRDATGLYIGHVGDMTEVLTTERGFQNPTTSPVGATLAVHEHHAAEGQQAHYALAVRQRSQAHTRRHAIPRRVKDLSGQLRDGEGRPRRRGPGRVRDVYPSKDMTVGRFPLRPSPIRNTSTAQGAPEQVRFIDVCCGIGGFTSAGILAGWKPVASIDYCKSWAKRFHWDYSHPFVKANICKWKERNRLVHTYKNIDVCLFSPPCQPYSAAGLKRSGGKRSKVVGAGLDLILGWKPSLVVIECAASFLNPETNPVYKEQVLPRLSVAGYDVYVVNSGALECGMGVSHSRVLIVATNYPRGDALERHVGALGRQRPTAPAQTSSLSSLDQTTYEPRHENAGRIGGTVEPTRDRQLALGIAGSGPHWPRQALNVLMLCGIERHLRGRNPVGATKQAGTPACGDGSQGIDAQAVARTNARFLQGYQGGQTLPAHYASARSRRVNRGAQMGKHSQRTATKLARAFKSLRATSKNTLKKVRRNGYAPESEGMCPNEGCDTPPRNGLARAALINLVIHTDSMHHAVPSMGHKRVHAQVFVDECTRYAWVETYESGSHADFSRMLKRAEHKIRSQHMESKEYSDRRMTGQGRPVIHYFSEQSSEIVNAQLHRAKLARISTSESHDSSIAKSSNGLAKQAAHSMLAISTSLMVGAELPHVLWADAYKMAASIYNTKGHSANRGKSPYEMYYGKPPGDVVRKRFSGRNSSAHEGRSERKKRSKLRASSRPYTYMGTSSGGRPRRPSFKPPAHKSGRTKNHARAERSTHKNGANRSPSDRAAPENKKGTDTAGPIDGPGATEGDTWGYACYSPEECAKHFAKYQSIIYLALDGVSECAAKLALAANRGFPTGKTGFIAPMVQTKHQDLGIAKANLLSEMRVATPVHLRPSTGLNVPVNIALAYSAAQKTAESDKFRPDTSIFTAACWGVLKWVSRHLRCIADLCPHRSSESMESRHSVSLLNAQPTSNHKGSNDAMAGGGPMQCIPCDDADPVTVSGFTHAGHTHRNQSVNDGQTPVGRLPYGMEGWQHTHLRPEVLYCPECQIVCPTRNVPSKCYALEYEGQCDGFIREETNHDPPQPGEWDLDTKLIELIEMSMGAMEMPKNAEAYTHLELAMQMLAFTRAGELTIREMFDRRRKDGFPTVHAKDCPYLNHDEPYANETTSGTRTRQDPVRASSDEPMETTAIDAGESKTNTTDPPRPPHAGAGQLDLETYLLGCSETLTDEQLDAEGMGFCMMMCEETELLEPSFPTHQELDELEEKLDPSVRRKHSVSLLVARPDTNHKGSNDMANKSARGQTRNTTRDETLGRPPLQRTGRIGILHAENDYLLREQARLEQVWSDNNQGKLYIDSAVKDTRIEALKASQARVSTELARAENERDRRNDRITTLLNLIGRTAAAQVEGIVKSTMHVGMQDLVRMVHISVSLRVPPGMDQPCGSRARVAGRSLEFNTP